MKREVPSDDSHPNRNFVLGKVFKVGTATGNLALMPLRAAARTPLVQDRAERLAERGRDVGTDVRQRLEQAAVDVPERTIDRALAGPLPETVARSLAEHRVVERMIGEMLASTDEAAIASLLEEERIQEFARRLLTSPALERSLDSPEFHALLQKVLSSPQIRAALTAALSQQTTTMAGELGEAVRDRAVRFDGALERHPRKWFRRPARVEESVPYAGLATRGVALLGDILLIHLVFLIGGALVALVASLFGKLRPEWLVGTLVGSGWLLVVVAYFVTFWSTTGRTPGMHLMRLRVSRGSGGAPGILRSLVRLVGLALAIIPLFAGFLPVLVDGRRRALQDFLAGTVVLYDE